MTFGINGLSGYNNFNNTLGGSTGSLNNNYNLSNLQQTSMYGGNNFDIMLSNGLLGNGTTNYPSYNGQVLNPSMTNILGGVAQSLAGRLFGGGKNGITGDPMTSGTPYSSSLIPAGLSFMDMLGVIGSNVLPMLKLKGALGAIVQTSPQIFQSMTALLGGLKFLDQTKNTKPVELSMNPAVRDEMEYEFTVDHAGT